jgi:hypothetical protein
MEKEAVKGEKITTNRVAGMMDLFTFGANKAESANQAYSIIVDTEYFIDIFHRYGKQIHLQKFARRIR